MEYLLLLAAGVTVVVLAMISVSNVIIQGSSASNGSMNTYKSVSNVSATPYVPPWISTPTPIVGPVCDGSVPLFGTATSTSSSIAFPWSYGGTPKRYSEWSSLWLGPCIGSTLVNGSDSVDGLSSKTYSGLLPGTTYCARVCNNQTGCAGNCSNVQLGTLPSCPATGGTITTYGSYCVHTFTANGTFVPLADLTVDVLIVGGGGEGGPVIYVGGGGGAGGLIYSTSYLVHPQSYPVVVGLGGSGQKFICSGYCGENGGYSSFGGMVALGGGGGGSASSVTQNGMAGGSGGGGASFTTAATGGSGTAGQGYAGGGANSGYLCGGGGGAGAAGASATVGLIGGAGGIGQQYNMNGTLAYYAGGGGAGGYTGYITTVGAGGLGGGGNGGIYTGISGVNGTGGGGGGLTGSGGSGIVIIRYTKN